MIKDIIIIFLLGVTGYSYVTGVPVKSIIYNIEKQLNNTGLQIQSPIKVKES